MIFLTSYVGNREGIFSNPSYADDEVVEDRGREGDREFF